MIGVDGGMFFQIGLIIIAAAVAAYLLRLIKQPQILSYVLVGILVTPVFGLVTNTSVIESMSIIGIAFLLFIVGLEMDLKKLKNVALVSSLGGAIQIVIIFVLSYLGALLMGFLSLEAAYIGLMLAFSSTMVVMKLLSDKQELNTLHGRLAVGILLLQDVVAIFALSVLATLNGFTFALFGMAFLNFLAIFLMAFLASKYFFPIVFRFAAKNQELLLITSLAVCFIFSLLFHYLGFSVAIGAFIAGLTLGNLEYSFEIVGKVRSLRDFFSLLFFVSLGMELSLGVIGKMWIPLLVFVFAAIFLKPLIIMIITSLFRYTKKPAFLTSLSLAQIGEFSLILASQGLLLGHISQELFSVVVMVAIVSITLTSYFIKYDSWIYNFLEKPLKIFDIFTTEGLEYLPSEVKPKFILCGHDRIGYSILREFTNVKKKVLIVDYNPEIITKMVKNGYHCIYGDITDGEIMNKMNLPGISMLVSTIPGLDDSLFLINKVKAVNKKARIIVTASEIEDALKLYEKGADYVIMPHFLGGEHVANMITDLRKRRVRLQEEKDKHIAHLKDRKDLGHEHPKD